MRPPDIISLLLDRTTDGPYIECLMQTVVATPEFLRLAKGAGMSGEEIEKMIDLLAANPRMGDVMQGTGGFRKFRFAGRGKGKSGGYRIVSFYAGETFLVFLIDVSSKGDKANLTPAQRNTLKSIGKDIVSGYAKPRRPEI